jgi:16S rRNA (guanine527-N7)-methyltransferase
MTKEEFILECKKINIDINEELFNKLNRYKDLLIEWNQKFNLTTIIEEKDIFLKHFFDSLYLSTQCDFTNKSICDIGTGAGFPGMVLAIVFKDSNFTLMESNNKKILFLEAVKLDLDLKNVNIISARAEEYGKNNRELFDIITCRAVSALNIILELSTSMLKVNGLFIPMKSNVEEELKLAEKNIDKLSYTLLNKVEYELPIEFSKRTILVFKKYKSTNLKFPRNYNVIKKQ